MTPRHPLQPFGDIGQRGVPGDLVEPAVGSPAQWIPYSVGIVDDLGERDPLGTGESLGERMLLVRAQRDQPVVLDRGDHSAQRLADPAVGGLVLPHDALPTR